ncbi:MAG TPA: STELLO glycosyltransferase family protein [Verrucomicrobiae bacterium]|nr:STELLO glycosyltransferase family protein [Verrucomicrobiae bacterium]
MNPKQLYSVVTTIQPPTAAMQTLARALARCGGQLIIAADKKGPHTYPLAGSELLTLDQQTALPFRLPKLLPVNHYVRKNAGYLIAISRGAACIYETDDDNAPNQNWKPRSVTVRAAKIDQPGWCNVYAHFSRKLLWPRGFPLEEIMPARAAQFPQRAAASAIFSPIQQGLADGNPDVDAIWRLVQSTDIRFASKPSLALAPGVWCPFNSQTTWWWPEAYPLLYLPSYCTFRMTDIWRSFIAQRCVWELGGAVTFHAPEVVQDRNQHNLMRDFQDETPGYLSNAKICQILGALKLARGQDSVSENLIRCYEALAGEKIFPAKELRLVKAWLADLKSISRGATRA